MRLVALAAPIAAVLVACAGAIPKAELDRCTLGLADGNDAYGVRQGTACGLVAGRLASDRPDEAMSYARKSCALEDARGCLEYLALARCQPSAAPDALLDARTAGERACAGMILADDGADARPLICARTADLYLDLSPRSRDDAGRLFARACKLGDDSSCARATALGTTLTQHPVDVAANSATFAPAPAHALQPATSASAMAAPPTVACHEMRPCVSLDVQQRNTSEVVGTIANHCTARVTCTWCPARGAQVDRSSCRSATLAPDESRAGREAGLWYDGYDAIAYDCMDASDARGCLAM